MWVVANYVDWTTLCMKGMVLNMKCRRNHCVVHGIDKKVGDGAF
jgi:hypothetical protein